MVKAMMTVVLGFVFGLSATFRAFSAAGVFSFFLSRQINIIMSSEHNVPIRLMTRPNRFRDRDSRPWVARAVASSKLFSRSRKSHVESLSAVVSHQSVFGGFRVATCREYERWASG